jgi:hypothetical protein
MILKYNYPIRERICGQHSKTPGDFSQGKKQDIAVNVLTDYVERIGGARGLEK